MRSGMAWFLVVGLAVGSIGCGGSSDGNAAEAAARAEDPANLQAAGWVGGEPVALTGKAANLRAVFFLDLDSKAAEAQARQLAEVSADHPDLVLVGATRSRDRAAVGAFRERVGFSGPVAFGVTAEALDHYHVQQRPSLRVVGRSGTVIGREVITLMAHLGRPKGNQAAR